MAIGSENFLRNSKKAKPIERRADANEANPPAIAKNLKPGWFPLTLMWLISPCHLDQYPGKEAIKIITVIVATIIHETCAIRCHFTFIFLVPIGTPTDELIDDRICFSVIVDPLYNNSIPESINPGYTKKGGKDINNPPAMIDELRGYQCCCC